MAARPGEVMPSPGSPLVQLLPTLGSRARVEQAGDHEERVPGSLRALACDLARARALPSPAPLLWV